MEAQFRSFLSLVMFASLFFSCTQNQSQQAQQTVDSLPAGEIISDSVHIETPKMQVPESIDEIKQAYAVTMEQWRAGKLDSLTLEYNCQNERQGSVTYYSLDSTLTLIRHQYAEYDHHSATDTYFLHEEQPYFMLFSQASWMFIAQGLTQDTFTEKRTYVLHEEAALCLEKQYLIRSDAPGQRQKETQNKAVPCPEMTSVLSDLQRLQDFKDQPDPDCLQL